MDYGFDRGPGPREGFALAQWYLSTLEVPLDKEAAIRKALNDGADAAIITALRDLPDDGPPIGNPDPERQREGPLPSHSERTYSASVGTYYDPTTGQYIEKK